MSYISTRVWLIEVFSHLPRILDSCHQRRCSERRRDWRLADSVRCECERRTEFNPLTADLGRRPLNSVTRYRLSRFGVKRTCENWTPRNCKWEYERCRLAPRNKWIGLAFRRKLGVWTKAGILAYWAIKDLARIGVGSATAMRSKIAYQAIRINYDKLYYQFLF